MCESHLPRQEESTPDDAVGKWSHYKRSMVANNALVLMHLIYERVGSALAVPIIRMAQAAGLVKRWSVYLLREKAGGDRRHRTTTVKGTNRPICEHPGDTIQMTTRRTAVTGERRDYFPSSSKPNWKESLRLAGREGPPVPWIRLSCWCQNDEIATTPLPAGLPP